MELEVAIDKLESLGSPDAIAEFFKYEGIQGYARNGTQCPVTKYLIRENVSSKGQFIHTSQVDVTIHNMPQPNNNWLDDETIKSVSMDDYSNVRDFIENFDDGEYSNLLKGD